MDAADLAAAGVAPEEIAKLQAHYGTDAAPLPILPANWRALRVFLGQSRRWLLWPDGRRRALDLMQVESALRLARVPPRERPDLEWRLAVLEGAALEAMTG